MNERISPSIRAQIDNANGGVEVVSHYGGLGRLLCWLGFHHGHGLEIDSEHTATDVLVCLRCGRYLAVVETSWEDE